jgi:hypothetical protein
LIDTNHPLYKEYVIFCNLASDINEHMPLLYELGCRCKHITEFGVGFGRSTRAFVASLLTTNGVIRSYDVKLLDGVPELLERCKLNKLNVEFNLKSTLDADIEETDLLLVDSLHTYDQVRLELQLHSHKVKKYIIFHDTVTYGEFGQTEDFNNVPVGILPAINEWLSTNHEWYIKEERINNNGLMICERR